jgi:hypothetical protein
MSVTSFKKASRAAKYLRILVEGPSGSGKTYGALLMAYGMLKLLGEGEIFVLDTEKGSSNSYTNIIDREYYVGDISAPYHPEALQQKLQEAVDAGAKVVIVDSITHFWEGSGGCLEINETLAKSKFRGNTYAAWSETKKIWRRMIEFINALPCHVILTGRSKTETAQVNEGGRSTVKRLGMKLQAGENLEYEMDLAFSIVHDQHLATCIKDRTALFVDKIPSAITPEFGERLVNWLNSADQPSPPPELVKHVLTEPSVYETAKAFLLNGATPDQVNSSETKVLAYKADGTLTDFQADELLAIIKEKQAK